ncbi:MAG: transcription termination/antitermination protein NusA [Candidatus Moranbacteria bacterium]|nr:transcription termination/antitermination protein NusA [Candidatus Moranbacteria bacterium]PIP25698.1 MAG: transcription termination/antitermination protein NusA [Candidatus Moranbacteria bacterium CG23_combo_of_CG06-09_8_20_14_all_41_28]PIV86082.1 MAG: transcription termination/antitermination protein NusA [Candidatus Moranbacteria bacterium CG17_big_fil_post_rev_8_21_14_2_50_41_107]PIW94033.1 MAG: transcription termination/antitermination protein NusA [Candidatus Moranbacteria bacterium CG_
MAKKKVVEVVENEEGSLSGRLGEFGSAVMQIAEEKGISKERVLEVVEAALAAAYKKDYGKKGQIIKAVFDEVKKEANFFLVKEVVDETVREFVEEVPEGEEENKEEGKEEIKEDAVEDEDRLPRFNAERDILLAEAKKIKKSIALGETIEMPLESHDSFGRVAAQTAKQVIIQRIREAERESMFTEYKEKEGQVVNGIIQRVEGRNVFVDLGKSVGILFPSEQIEGENYHVGQHLKVFLARVESDTKGPGLLLSRAHPEMVRHLFSLEVPEIFTGTVEVKALAREAGSRTKIAVFSAEEGVDPIGSCVGQKGTRVQAIIDELGGEKIDIIEWNENPEKFISAALAPSKVLSVKISEEEKKAIVIVPADQLSLAIGKRGQNVRLAAKLTGYKIDVTSEEAEAIETPSEDMPEVISSDDEVSLEEK